jgi:predicted membrane chloride channel (bestrophin family)
MNSEIRNLTRLIWVTIPEPSQSDHIQKITHIKMLLGFAYAVRHGLLEDHDLFQDVEKLLPEDMKDSVLYENAMPLPYQIAYRVLFPLVKQSLFPPAFLPLNKGDIDILIRTTCG